MSKKLDALMATLNDEKVSVIHDNGPAGPNVVAFIDMPKSLSTSEKLEEAFMLTNSIDDAWYTSDEVEYIGPEKACRSTSVGDMIMLNNGKKFKCEHIGWSEV